MSETPDLPSTEELSALAARAADAVRLAEEANAKANSEALFAFNAKKVAEEHATVISELKGRVESEAGWFTSTRQGIEQTQAAVNTIKAAIEAAQRSSTEAGTEVEKARGVISTLAADIGEAAAQAKAGAGEVANVVKVVLQHSETALQQRNAGVAAGARIQALLEQLAPQADKAQCVFRRT